MGLYLLQIGQFFLYVLIIYSVIVYFISDSFNDSIQQYDLPQLTEKQFNVVTEIKLVQNNHSCPQDYQSLLSQNWPGLNEGFYCNNQKAIYRKNEKNFKHQNCSLLQQVSKQTINTFGLQTPKKNEIYAFKLCGKIYQNFEMIQQNQLTKEQIQNLEENLISPNMQENQEKTKQSFIQKQFRMVVSEDQSVQNLNTQSCQEGKRECFYLNIIFCVDKNEDCPISDISIQKRDPTINQNSKDLYHIDQEYDLVIKREHINKQPLVEFVISQKEGVCKNNQEQVFNQDYLLDKRTKCNQIDPNYKSISQFTISSKELYSINQIDLGDHQNYISEVEQYSIFVKEFDSNSEQCISEEENRDIKQILQQLRSQSANIETFILFIALILVLLSQCKRYIQAIQPYIDPAKLEASLLYICLFIYFFTLWKITSAEIKFGKILDLLSQFLQRDCLNKNIASQIRKYMHNSIDVKLGFLIGFLYIPLIIYFGVMLVKRFCWMKRYPVHVIPPKKQNLIEMKSNIHNITPQRRIQKK